MDRIVTVGTPNTEEPGLKVSVWQPDAEESEEVADTLLDQFILEAGIIKEVVLTDRQYLIVQEAKVIPPGDE